MKRYEEWACGGIRRAGRWLGSVCRKALTPRELAVHLVGMLAIELAKLGLENGWRLLEALWLMMS